MSEELENLPVTLDFSLHLKLNLSSHLSKLFMALMLCQVPHNSTILNSRSVNLPNTYQLTRRIWHECAKTDKHDDSPWDLNCEGEAPLDVAVGGKTAEESDPVGHHGSEGDTAARDAAYETSVF